MCVFSGICVIFFIRAYQPSINKTKKCVSQKQKQTQNCPPVLHNAHNVLSLATGCLHSNDEPITQTPNSCCLSESALLFKPTTAHQCCTVWCIRQNSSLATACLHSTDESITITLCAPSNSCCTSESALLFKNGLFGLLAYCYLLCTERLFADYFITRRAYLTPGEQLLQL